MSDVTRILRQIEDGDGRAAEKLLPLVYDELRRLAAIRLANERAGHSFDATALVHEAYLRLVGKDAEWNSRGHFFAAAAEAMRRILVEDARRKRQLKRGGNRRREPLEAIRDITQLPPSDLLAVDDALRELTERDLEKAKVVTMRFYAGYSIAETGKLLGISEATVKRHWAFARAWLFARLKDRESGM